MDLTNTTWRKSTRSGNGGNCVEVADLTASIGVRDSKAPATGHLSLTPEAWTVLLAKIRDGQFELT